jgi:hypothetical protein
MHDYFKLPYISPQWLHSYNINAYPEPMRASHVW